MKKGGKKKQKKGQWEKSKGEKRAIKKGKREKEEEKKRSKMNEGEESDRGCAR